MSALDYAATQLAVPPQPPRPPLLTFNMLLENAGFDPAKTVLVRHVPVEKAMRFELPRLVVERPDLWLSYQRIQWPSLEKAMLKAATMASFIGQEGDTATFAGLYRVGDWQELDSDGYNNFPGNGELVELGMKGTTADAGSCKAFELEPLDQFAEWTGHLTITWPKPSRAWWRWAARGVFPISTIEAESRFVHAMPEWQDVVLSWNELLRLPRSWASAFAQWRGVYFIYDTTRRAGYVGSAYGADNILGRWRNYAQSGHGGNRELRHSQPADLRFSILQLTSPDLEPAHLIAIENSWKQRLHTRDFGLNRN